MSKSRPNNNPYANNQKFRHTTLGWIGYCVSVSNKDVFLFIPEQDRIACVGRGEVVEIR
jgi:hypothetical protein